MAMLNVQTLSTLSGAVLLATVAGPSFADISFAKAEKMRASGEAISTEKVVEVATKARPGTVTDLELDRDFGRLVYEVEVRDEQFREWDLEIDAKSGEILTQEMDD
ncbi:MAG: PepSY domain-containing protein [Gammaproteobacteria bacterium]